jgi:D-3-phosphoglycerate dehydrogenase
MKPGAFVVNVSRGGVIDEAALARALSDGRIAGAGLDVYESEPLAADNPLLSAPNLVLTPHLGASTGEAQVQVALEVATSIRAALIHGDVSAAVNAAEMARAAGLS